MVNVPMAVWIDEQGTIVRPAEIAGASESFRSGLDRDTFERSAHSQAEVRRVREAYSAAVRAWVLEGRHALPPAEARARLRLPTPTDALAATHARLGELLWVDAKERRFIVRRSGERRLTGGGGGGRHGDAI